ncbi:MAG: hypothetical protein AAGI06_01895 [Pseudomonadota bacterium]
MLQTDKDRGATDGLRRALLLGGVATVAVVAAGVGFSDEAEAHHGRRRSRRWRRRRRRHGRRRSRRWRRRRWRRRRRYYDPYYDPYYGGPSIYLEF